MTAPDLADDTRPTPAPNISFPLVAGVATLLLWASGFVVIRHLAGAVSPGALSSGRLLVAALVLAPFALRRDWVAPTRRDWVLIAVAGLSWFTIYNLALNAGEERVDAGSAALIIQIGPILIAVLAVLFLGERLTGWLILGLVIGFAGVALIAYGLGSGSNGGSGSSNSQVGTGDLLGVGLVAIAAVMYAVGVLAQKPLLRRIPALQATWLCLVVGALACLPYAVELPRVLSEDPAAFGWVVYLGVLPTAVAFSLWAYALTHTDASKLALTTFLVPLLATLISWAALGETPPPLALAGGALAISGVLLSRR